MKSRLARNIWIVFFCLAINTCPPQPSLASDLQPATQVFLPFVFTPACDTDYAFLYLSPSNSVIQVGQTLTITATLRNYGCPGLGVPQYRLSIDTSPTQPVLSPINPGPVTHYLGIGAGLSDQADFVFQGIAPGQATLQATASFEVHIGYPGPAYWGGAGSEPIMVTVSNPMK